MIKRLVSLVALVSFSALGLAAPASAENSVGGYGECAEYVQYNNYAWENTSDFVVDNYPFTNGGRLIRENITFTLNQASNLYDLGELGLKISEKLTAYIRPYSNNSSYPPSSLLMNQAGYTAMYSSSTKQKQWIPEIMDYASYDYRQVDGNGWNTTNLPSVVTYCKNGKTAHYEFKGTLFREWFNIKIY
ncbi:hypothetical protein RSal33209_3334 [Renibacterium salmoninarum ATCC 33209]|uniref:Uncharacterized protein n=1 Tax=Renibacterium salmoninarum (strain ATCC 33209 / DSM 20767 / JCM 11484 / NBRC 15589 / NCIMB 2235) TaxID=288705 RepID=A9WV24_RENSM|nr:hypothetical protein RSal33209_3334 [Renibacterium salmoninarum ATCC 33209]